jgi:hypothetical protein
MDNRDPAIGRDLAIRTVRVRLASHIRAAAAREAEAVRHLERAVTRMRTS